MGAALRVVRQSGAIYIFSVNGQGQARCVTSAPPLQLPLGISRSHGAARPGGRRAGRAPFSDRAMDGESENRDCPHL